MATRKPYTPPSPHPLFRDSFERHRHLIGPMLDGDEAALAALTSTEDGFRAALYPRFCHDDTRYAVYDRYPDARDLQPCFDHPIQIVAREHPEWIGNALIDPTVAESEIGPEIQKSLFYWIGLAFLSGMGDPMFMDEEALLASLDDEEEDAGEREPFVPDRELPASLGEYCLSLFRGEHAAGTEQRLAAMHLLANFRPLPPDTFAVLGGCILGERDRDTKALMIRLLDSDEAAAHMDPALVPKLKTMRSRLRRTMDPQVGEALDRIITRLGGTPPKHTPRVIPPPDSLFRDSFERHRHHIEPMLNGDENALAALAASEDAFRASLYPCYCHDDTHYTIHRHFDDWRDRSDAYHQPLFKVLREHPGWVDNLLRDPILRESKTGRTIRENVRIYADLHRRR
jgi:hypothetical protein